MYLINWTATIFIQYCIVEELPILTNSSSIIYSILSFFFFYRYRMGYRTWSRYCLAYKRSFIKGSRNRQDLHWTLFPINNSCGYYPPYPTPPSTTTATLLIIRIIITTTVYQQDPLFSYYPSFKRYYTRGMNDYGIIHPTTILRYYRVYREPYPTETKDITTTTIGMRVIHLLVIYRDPQDYSKVSKRCLASIFCK